MCCVDRLNPPVISAIETSELRRAEKRILHMAHHDPLTHLPNRASLQEKLKSIA